MGKNINIILSVLVLIFLLSSPFLAYSYKVNSVKKALHVDNERYAEVNYVCFEDKYPDQCLSMLNEDLRILIYEHELNSKVADKEFSAKEPITVSKIIYNRLENKYTVEPEILLKTLLVKRTLFRDFKKTVETGMFGAKMETYIIKNFEEPNRSRAVKLLKNQDKNFEDCLKKRAETEAKKAALPAY